MDLFDQLQVDYHYREVHGIEQGDLVPDNSGTVESLTEGTIFTCPSLHGIEEMGEVGQALHSGLRADIFGFS